MSYLFEDDLFNALKDYDRINTEIKLLTDRKDEIRDKIKKWREVNNINEKVTMTQGDNSWILDVITQNRKSVRDFETLIKKLGKDAEIFISVNTIESLRITKR